MKRTCLLYTSPLCVECQVSGRYLRFHEKSDIVQAGEFITVDVMAMQMDEDKPSKKIDVYKRQARGGRRAAVLHLPVRLRESR